MWVVGNGRSYPAGLFIYQWMWEKSMIEKKYWPVLLRELLLVTLNLCSKDGSYIYIYIYKRLETPIQAFLIIELRQIFMDHIYTPLTISNQINTDVSMSLCLGSRIDVIENMQPT